jgi:hypothetical protein
LKTSAESATEVIGSRSIYTGLSMEFSTLCNVNFAMGCADNFIENTIKKNDRN